MEDLFFDTSYTTLQQMLMKVFAFLLVSGLLVYVIYFALTKILFRKNKHRKEINLRLVFLWTIFAYFILFNFYIFVLLYNNGIDSLYWTNAKFYLGIIAQLTIYIGLFAYFFIKRYSLNKIINEKSIS
jgi:heme/copper-type cytochrome/quinol oxidase subunit 2